VVTYNQERFIGQCLQSLVDQQTNFPFEIIVADDCSTDGTAQIIKKFAADYPELIKPLLRPKNVGAYENGMGVHQSATGEYIAHMDGDDYALPGKLQVQADYLDAHPDCNIVWHRMHVLNDRTGAMAEDLLELDRLGRRAFTRGDILALITVGMNSSKMYRSSVREFVEPDFCVVDFFANVEQVRTGTADFAADVPYGVYRAGIGIAAASNKTKVLLKQSFMYFAAKYPHLKAEIACSALVLFAAALKNRHWENVGMFGRVLLATLRPRTVSVVMRNREMISMLRIPPAVR
jgi:glycosyltransferase involved in cell wall biosynthesis